MDLYRYCTGNCCNNETDFEFGIRQTLQCESAPGQGAAVLGKVGRIEVSGLSFSYPGSGRRLFGDLSFCANNPSLVILRGNNGSGKTTLVKILLRLLGGYDGTIRVDGID